MTNPSENGRKTAPPLIAGKEQAQPAPCERAATECEAAPPLVFGEEAAAPQELLEEDRRHQKTLAAMEQPSLLSDEAWAQEMVERVRAWCRVARGMLALRRLGATSEQTRDQLATLDREALLLRIQVHLRSSWSTVPLAYADVCKCLDVEVLELAALLASLQRHVLNPV